MEDLYKNYYKYIFNVAKLYKLPTEDCEEIAHDVLLKYSAKYTNDNPDIKYILKAITKNCALDYIRMQDRRSKLLDKYLLDFNEEESTPTENNDLYERINDILDENVAYRYRLVLEEAYLQGKTYPEIGKKLGISYNTVKVLLSRAKANVRNHYIRRYGRKRCDTSV